MIDLMMKHAIIILSMLVASFCWSAEEVMWWQIDDETTIDWYGENVSIGELQSTKGELLARVYVETHPEYKQAIGTYMMTWEGDVITSDTLPVDAEAGVSGFNFIPDDVAGLSFYIELGNFQDGKWLGYVVSDVRPYTWLKDEGHIDEWSPGRQPFLAIPWMPSFAVPEPDSSILVMIGLAVLMLFRPNRLKL